MKIFMKTLSMGSSGGHFKIRLRPSVAEFRPSEFRPPSVDGTRRSSVRPPKGSVRPRTELVRRGRNPKNRFRPRTDSVRPRTELIPAGRIFFRPDGTHSVHGRISGRTDGRRFWAGIRFRPRTDFSRPWTELNPAGRNPSVRGRNCAGGIRPWTDFQPPP